MKLEIANVLRKLWPEKELSFLRDNNSPIADVPAGTSPRGLLAPTYANTAGLHKGNNKTNTSITGRDNSSIIKILFVYLAGNAVSC